MDLAFQIIILIISVILHEVAHGAAADYLGDPTARLAGRLTLNPLAHLDPFGSFLLPLLTYSFGGFIIGWAKPVPYNPYNLRNGKWGPAYVAAAGPAVNLILAIIFSIVIRFGESLGSPPLIAAASIIVLLNILLAIFNLIPIPPLDGSKILFAILPYRLRGIETFLLRYQFLLILIVIFFLWEFLLPLVFLIFRLFTGLAF